MPQGESSAEEAGREVFAARCASCHGEAGEGGRAPALVGLRLLPAEIHEGIVDGHDGDAGPLPRESAGLLAAFVERIQFDGRLLQFPWVWAVEAGVWMHEENSFLQPLPEVEADERPGDRWGYSCDECHSVRPRYRWRAGESVAESSAVELGIACEACHGAGRAHVERHQPPWARYRARLDEQDDDIVNPADLDATRSSHVCAQCHADVVREDDGYLPYRPGDDLRKSVFFVRLQEPPYPKVLARALEDEPTRLADSFWNDGTVRIAGRDFNGLLESPCHTRGVGERAMSCISCHRMHGEDPDDQLAPAMRGDAACLQCHEDKRDIEAHTHHPASSSGSRCYNCHMPHTTYGLMKAIRAHRVDSPSVARELESGRPNACNLCHLDKTLAETADTLSEWYAQPELTVPSPWDETAASVVWLLRGDAVVRAVTAWHLGWEPALRASGRGWQAPLLVQTLPDDYVAVRFLAWRALTQHEGFEQLDFPYDGDDAELTAFADSWRAAAQKLARPFAGRAELVLDENAALLQDEVIALLLERDTTEVRVAE
jgi:predicted CXXCH cytochrome family protein